MDYYDMVIIGAGPSGLALAHCYSLKPYSKILIIDKEKTIGGCHRMKKINDTFTEQIQKIYLSNYINFFFLLSEIGLHINDVFVKYKYSLLYLFFYKVLPFFTIYESCILLFSYILYLFQEDYGKQINLKTFCEKKHFSNRTFNIIDRICLFIDGADMSKHSLNKILKIYDLIFMVDVYQPKKTTDFIFNKWKSFLEKRRVSFLLGYNVLHIKYNHKKSVIECIVLDNNKIIFLNKLVLAIPPSSIARFLRDKEIKNCFGNFEIFEQWSEYAKYNKYLTITYHFSEDIKHPIKNHIITSTEWGLVIINLLYNKKTNKTCIKSLNVAVIFCDKKSSYINKTANECSQKELIKETFRQLKENIISNVPDYQIAIINPNVYYNLNKKMWCNFDEAYFNAFNAPFIPFHSKVIKNIYNVGIHNGKSYNDCTTIESAVSNAMVLACSLYPPLKRRYFLRKFTKTRDIIIIIAIGMAVFMTIYFE